MTGTTISGTYLTPVTLSNAATQNPATVAAGVMISAPSTALVGDSGTAWTVANYGVIEGSGADGIGISFAGSGTVFNDLPGLISGTTNGVALAGGTAVNQSSITGGQYGIYLSSGGAVTNVGGGTVVAAAAGVEIKGGPGSIYNAGGIYATGPYSCGVELISGGSVTNQTGGAITGTLYGLQSSNSATVTNSGLIGGAGAVIGIGLAFGQVTNTSTGTIAGTSSGIRIYGGGTVMDAGTVSGGGDAVHFYSGSTALLVVDPGAVFAGAVDGGNAVGATATSTLELASAANIGTLSGLGTQFVNFTQITVDAGAQWAFDTTDTVGAGVTLTNSGTIEGTVTLAAGANLTNGPTATISAYGGSVVYGLPGSPATIVNSGLIINSATTASYGISLAQGGSVTNNGTATISGYNGITADGPLTLVNAGYIAGVRTGVYLAAGSVSNQSDGTISGISGVVGGSAAVTILNAGYIAGALAVSLASGGYVTNQSGGTIVGFDGIAGGGSLTVVNDGSISGFTFGTGIEMQAGGSVTNQSSGSITGYTGIDGYNGAVTVVNHGVIAGSADSVYGTGVLISDGGSVTNRAHGTISGYEAIYSGYLVTTVVNAGDIAGFMTGPHGAGVLLSAGGSVTNQSGTIAGYSGIGGGNYGAVTVVNAGTIAGIAAAVKFVAGYADQVVVDPNAVFAGMVDGGNMIGATVVSTLELVTGGSTGTLSGIGTQYVNFGQITIDASASWILTGSNSLAAGITLTNAGALTLRDTTLYDAGLVINDGAIRIDPSTVTLDDLTGAGDVTIAGGSTLDVSGTVVGGETIVFDSGSNLLGIDPAAFSGQIDGFTVGDTIELTGVTDGSLAQLVNGNTLEIERTGNLPIDLTLDPSVSYVGNHYQVSAQGAVIEVPCFLRDTLIRAETGEVMVQDLAIGDRVMTLSGQSRPIMWIGTGRMRVAPGHRSAATPVIVRRSALADGVPCHDLRITKGHALFVDGVLIPAEFLVNHRSIHWDDHKQEVAFYHIELETHDVLIANGASTESYRDDGNRWLFGNPNSGWDQPPKLPCAPVLTGGPIVDAIWRRLLDRNKARTTVTLTDDPDLHLLVDGMRVDPVGRRGSAYNFRLARHPRKVRLVSRSAVPAELGLTRDMRALGVAVTRIMLAKAAKLRLLDAGDPSLTEGFHGFEPALGLGWTDGDATLPDALFEGFEGGGELVVQLGGTTKYPAFAAAIATPAA